MFMINESWVIVYLANETILVVLVISYGELIKKIKSSNCIIAIVSARNTQYVDKHCNLEEDAIHNTSEIWSLRSTKVR